MVEFDYMRMAKGVVLTGFVDHVALFVLSHAFEVDFFESVVFACFDVTDKANVRERTLAKAAAVSAAL